MSKMRYTYRLPGRSVSEVFAAFRHALTNHQAQERDHYGGRRVTQELFLNAIVDHVCGLPFAEQARIIRDFLPRYDRMGLTPAALVTPENGGTADPEGGGGGSGASPIQARPKQPKPGTGPRGRGR